MANNFVYKTLVARQRPTVRFQGICSILFKSQDLIFGEFIMYVSVGCDDHYQKIARRLNILLACVLSELLSFSRSKWLYMQPHLSTV